MRFRLPQTCVYWPPNGADSTGRPKYASPVQLPCRWEDKIQETIDSTGATVLSGAVIYLSQSVLVGGVLFLGVIDTVQGSNWLPAVKANLGTREIINVGNVPSLKATQSLTTAMVK